MLNIFQAIGFCWVVLTSGLGTIGIFYAAFQFVRRAKVAMVRGIVEENRDIEVAWERRVLDRMQR